MPYIAINVNDEIDEDDHRLILNAIRDSLGYPTCHLAYLTGERCGLPYDYMFPNIRDADIAQRLAYAINKRGGFTAAIKDYKMFSELDVPLPTTISSEGQLLPNTKNKI